MVEDFGGFEQAVRRETEEGEGSGEALDGALGAAIGLAGDDVHRNRGAVEAEVVAEGLEHRGVDHPSPLGLGGDALPAAKLLLRFVEADQGEIDRLAIVRHQHGEAQHLARPGAAAELFGLQQFMDSDEVAQALAHLLAFDLKEAIVQRIACHRIRPVGATRLGDLVLVVREDEVEAAGMDVEDLAQIALAHGGALDVPPGPAAAPRRVPAGLVLGGSLPQHEVGGVALVGLDLDASAGEVVLELAAGERAIVGHRADVEQHFADFVGLVGVPVGDELADDGLHLRDIVGGARLHRRQQAAERRGVLLVLRRGGLGDPADGVVQR